MDTNQEAYQLLSQSSECFNQIWRNLQSKRPVELWETGSSRFQGSCSQDESHDPIDYSNVPPENQTNHF